MTYDPTIYQGSAPDYLRGRPPYSLELQSILLNAMGLDSTGRFTGAPTAPSASPDRTLRRAAHEQTVGGIRWVQARAEELPDAAPGPYRLVTSISHCPGRRRTRSAAVLTHFPRTFVSCCGDVHPTAASGIGPATPR